MVKKRCNFCLKKLRADGTCQNPKCPRYVPEKTETTEEPTQETTEEPTQETPDAKGATK